MRLFVAIELDESVRRELGRVQESLKSSCSGVRWVAIANLHLTVKFLGEVADDLVPEVMKAAKRAAKRCDGFALKIAGCGCFPAGGKVRVVWAGADEGTGAAARCAAALDEELSGVGFEKEQRPFSSHITLGRVRDDRSGGEIRRSTAAHSLVPLTQTVVSLTVMSSVLAGGGPTYTPIGKVKLG